MHSSVKVASTPLTHTVTPSTRHDGQNLTAFTLRVINMVQFTPINLGLPWNFYGGAYGKCFENVFSSSFQQLIFVLLSHT